MAANINDFLLRSKTDEPIVGDRINHGPMEEIQYKYTLTTSTYSISAIISLVHEAYDVESRLYDIGATKAKTVFVPAPPCSKTKFFINGVDFKVENVSLTEKLVELLIAYDYVCSVAFSRGLRKSSPMYSHIIQQKKDLEIILKELKDGNNGAIAAFDAPALVGPAVYKAHESKLLREILAVKSGGKAKLGLIGLIPALGTYTSKREAKKQARLDAAKDRYKTDI